MTYPNNSFKSALKYEGKVLAGYKYQIEVQKKLLIKIKSTLPDHLAPHALNCVISDNKILLYTDSAIWSSQLRFYQKNILQGLSKTKNVIYESVQIKIIPTGIEKTTNESKIIPSLDNINQIHLQAQNQKDEKLKLSLIRLGKTLEKLAQ